MSDGIVRAGTLAELERRIMGAGAEEGASAPAFRSPRQRRFEEEITVDDSRVTSPDLEEPRMAPRPFLGESARAFVSRHVPAISLLDVVSGVVDTRWGQVVLDEKDRAKIAGLVVAAVRRAWDGELLSLSTERVPVALEPAPVAAPKPEPMPVAVATPAPIDSIKQVTPPPAQAQPRQKLPPIEG